MAGNGMNDMVANMVAQQMEKAVDQQLAEIESDMHNLEGARQRRMPGADILESRTARSEVSGIPRVQDFWDHCLEIVHV